MADNEGRPFGPPHRRICSHIEVRQAGRVQKLLHHSSRGRSSGSAVLDEGKVFLCICQISVLTSCPMRNLRKIRISHKSHTVDRHKFNHLATNSTTFAAFSQPLYCM